MEIAKSNALHDSWNKTRSAYYKDPSVRNEKRMDAALRCLLTARGELQPAKPRRFEGRTEIISFRDFMSGAYKRPTKWEVVLLHFERNKVVYKVAGITIMLVLACEVSTFATDPGIDAKASAIYHSKLLPFGEWAIIIKGAWATIHKTLQEDFDGAKKSFFSYLLVYLFLLAFPWAMHQMDGLFA